MDKNLLKLPNKGLVFAHINVCSIRNKIQELYSLIQANNIHILAVTETHLDSFILDPVVALDGYSLFRNDRDRHGGGVAIYVQNHLPSKVCREFMCSNVEALWVQIHLPHLKPVLVGCCYRPPSANSQYFNDMCDMIDMVADSKTEIYLLCDMNIDWLDTNCSVKKKLSSLANACNLTQIVTAPTRVVTNSVGHTSSTCIDHMYTSCPELCSKPISIPVGFSDHNIIATARKFKVPKSGPKVIYKRSYKGFIEDRFLADVGRIDWKGVYAAEDPDISLKEFMNVFMNIVNLHTPMKKFTVKSKSAPWIDEEIKGLMSERDEAKRVWVTSRSAEDKLTYCTLRNRVTKLNKAKKKEYYKQRISNAKHDGKQLWNTLNEIMGRNKNGCAPFVEANGEFLTKPVDIANHFNNFFTSKVHTLRQNMHCTDSNTFNLITNEIMKNKKCSFKFQCVEEEEVKRLLESLPAYGTAGTDNLDSKILKLASNHISGPICHILNRCVLTGRYPGQWKEGKIIPLPKDTRSTFSGPNSRPISILPVLSKIMERIIYIQIQNYFDFNRLTTKYQHAYRKGYSTCTALTQMTDDWFREIDNSKVVAAVMLDFSAAFDVIDHELLTGKLISYGFTQNAISLIRSYLCARTQRVCYNGSLSNINNITCGVPQGSCLGPLLYSIFTNDLPSVVKHSTLVMYADDSTMYCAANSSDELGEVISNELERVYEWITVNKLVLNISKTKSILFGSRHKLATKPKLELYVAKEPIEQVEKLKLLGMVIDNHLSWSQHIDRIIQKMGSGIHFTRQCSPYVPFKIQEQVCKSLILSHLDYCSVVWASASKRELAKLQVVQNRAARLVLGCSPRTGIHKMHTALSWLSVEKRLALSTATCLNEAIKTQRPESLIQQVVFCNTAHKYATRKAGKGDIVLPNPKTNSMKRTVLYRAIKTWNELPLDIREDTGKKTFKRKLKRYLLNG